MPTILLSAGDASGEAHAAELVQCLKRRWPDARFLGLGGPRMAAAGVEIVADQSALAVGGFLELGGSLTSIVSVWRKMVRALRKVRPDLVVLVDSGGFNLPFAKQAKRQGAPVLYYIAPQIWAWRAGRLRRLVSRTDRIAVLFSFEADFYARRNVSVDCVGHPILDDPSARPCTESVRARARESLGIEPAGPVIGLLPGSRRNEVESNLALQLEAIGQLRRAAPEHADMRVLLAAAPTVDESWLRSRVAISNPEFRVDVVRGGTDFLAAIDVALTKPGTNTVELLAREVPMVVMGRVHPVSAAIARSQVKVNWLSMPNLMAGCEIVPEFFQEDATAPRIAAALAPLLEERPGAPQAVGSAHAQRAALRATREELGAPGATARVADLVEEMLGTLSA